MARPKWNVVSPRVYGKDGEKTFWVNVGSAWENEQGKGKHDVVIELSALPLPDAEGKVRMFLFPNDGAGRNDKREEDFGRRAGKAAAKGRKSTVKDDMDDEIPF